MEYPFSFSSSTMEIPTSMAFSASCLVMAGPLVMFFVPQAIFRLMAWLSAAIPTSTGNRSAPALRQNRLDTASCFTMFSATRRVTSCPVWVTPSSTTPLSAHITSSAFFFRETSTFPVIPAIRTMVS